MPSGDPADHQSNPRFPPNRVCNEKRLLLDDPVNDGCVGTALEPHYVALRRTFPFFRMLVHRSRDEESIILLLVRFCPPSF